jgi:hypothetical protein
MHCTDLFLVPTGIVRTQHDIDHIKMCIDSLSRLAGLIALSENIVMILYIFPTLIMSSIDFSM